MATGDGAGGPAAAGLTLRELRPSDHGTVIAVIDDWCLTALPCHAAGRAHPVRGRSGTAGARPGADASARGVGAGRRGTPAVGCGG